MAKVKAPEPKGKIIAEYKIGNTTIRINDAYIAKTPEERAKVEREIVRVAWKHVHLLRAAGKDI